MSNKTVYLYEFLMQRSFTSRREGFLLWQISGFGAIVMPDQAFLPAMRWAQGKPSSGNIQRDLMLFVDRVDTLIPRFGTSIAAKGALKPLMQLAQAMAMGGLDLLEWGIPPDVKKAIEIERAAMSRAIGGKREEPKPEAEAKVGGQEPK
ncbi:MAG: hypothetical protein ACRETN_05945 [Nevskiales bacterium]